MPRPMNSRLASMYDNDLLKSIQVYGSANAAADALKIPRSSFKARAQQIKRFAHQRSHKPEAHSAPKRGVKTFILSSAQNGTEVAEPFFSNLKAYAEHLGAEILISGYTYNKSLFENHSKVEADYHPDVKPYLVDRQQNIGERLIFCANMNTLPTASDPLSGFETYTRSKWGVFPHPRICLKSIPVMLHQKPKQIMTTGSVTLPNYVQKKAGIKAEFHHVIGAVLVEIDKDGDTFCRHLIADKTGSFQDLDTVVMNGRVDEFEPVEAITWGDIHAERLDPKILKGAWGLTNDLERVGDPTFWSMVDTLEPRFQFFHDVLDMRRRNHHNVRDPHFRFEMWVNGTESVREEIERVAKFLVQTERNGTSYVVDSNHDRALVRWLKEADYKTDPVNATFFLECQAATYAAIERRDATFKPLKAAMQNMGLHLDNIVFLDRTDSFVICEESGGIECAMHGDQGANGAGGSVNSFAKMGSKANIADHHGATIYEGIYQAGHSCMRDMVYNRGGLTSWSPSHIVTYPNGKRTIVTMVGEKWRATA